MKEPLTKTDGYNEYVMTGLRTIWGVSLEQVEEFGERYLLYLLDQSKKKKYIHSEHLQN